MQILWQESKEVQPSKEEIPMHLKIQSEAASFVV